MSQNINGIPVICVEPPDTCEGCGKFAELRPYGPNGERICFDCANKDPETTKRTEAMMRKVLFGEKPIS